MQQQPQVNNQDDKRGHTGDSGEQNSQNLRNENRRFMQNRSGVQNENV